MPSKTYRAQRPIARAVRDAGGSAHPARPRPPRQEPPAMNPPKQDPLTALRQAFPGWYIDHDAVLGRWIAMRHRPLTPRRPRPAPGTSSNAPAPNS